MGCFTGCVFSSVKVIVGKFPTGGPEESSSLASLTSFCVVSEVVAVAFFFVGGRFVCATEYLRGSLPVEQFSSFRARGFSDFSSSGMNRPLYFL